jgi:pre-mRNA-processing factor SLU7
MATAQNTDGRLSREDFKKQKELEELRKAGAAMPALDEEGRMINPHIPQYISKTPWYYNTTGPTLKHQSAKLFEDRQGKTDDIFSTRTVKRVNTSGSKFRKGACENCGAMTHKTKECLDRPRAKNAKVLGRTLGNDESVSNPTLDFEGKRDRWNNFTPAMYGDVYDRHAMAEEARRAAQEKELAEKLKRKEERALAAVEGGADASDVDTDDEGDAGADAAAADEQTAKSAHNLRLREDPAKYLRNLDPNSAYYDPKTRSMRENPYQPDDPRALLYAGDNALRASGMTRDVAALQRFAWDANEQGLSDANPVALPSVLEAQHKAFLEKRQEAQRLRDDAITAKYGGAKGVRVATEYDGTEAADAFSDVTATVNASKALKKVQDRSKLTASEVYTEVGNTAAETKGSTKSKYDEDVLEINHSAVWGSFYNIETKQWGYGCCKSVIRNSYCNATSSTEIRKRKREGE